MLIAGVKLVGLVPAFADDRDDDAYVGDREYEDAEAWVVCRSI